MRERSRELFAPAELGQKRTHQREPSMGREPLIGKADLDRFGTGRSLNGKRHRLVNGLA